MSPAINAGDHVVMERMTYLARKPRRGDPVAFKTAGIATLPPGRIYVKRIAGEPGDQVQISDGKLFVNGTNVVLRNAQGEIRYFSPPFPHDLSLQTDVTVPAGHYYVLGDNSTNSADSRSWGFVPAENIIGQISFCYWPPRRIGAVK